MSQRDARVIGGVTTIVAALTAYSKKKKWEMVHTVAVVGGAALSLSGILS